MYAPDNAGMNVALARIGRAIEGASITLGVLSWATTESVAILIQSIPVLRRARIEAELGYRLPDFAWKAMEYQRRTEGSGNGRVIRE